MAPYRLGTGEVYVSEGNAFPSLQLIPPIVRLDLAQLLGLPFVGITGHWNGDFDVESPPRQSFLADAAGCEDDKRIILRRPVDADRSGYR